MTQKPCRDDQLAPQTKTASRIVIYLIEELGDARLRAAQLQGYVKQATDLIEKSEHRDHFFEVAAHLIQGIPETLFKLGKALDASALAAARLDYEEIKQGLKPEKADELESVMEDNRLRYLKRRSQEDTMDPKQASEALIRLATETEATGHVPVVPLLRILAALEPQGARTAADTKAMAQKAAECFRGAAKAILEPGKAPSRALLASLLRRVLADTIEPTAAQDTKSAIFAQATSRQDVIDGFMSANPSMSKEDAEKAADEWEKNKDVVKDKTASDETSGEKESRFEEGKPADPTENMSPEDAAEWKKQNEANKDKFKTAVDMTSEYAFAMAASKLQMAVDAFAYAEDEQGYMRGWGNLAKSLRMLSEFFKPLLAVAGNQLDKAADAAQRAYVNVPIRGYQHLESARRDLDDAAKVAKQGNIAASFKKLSSAMGHIGEAASEAGLPAIANAVDAAGAIFKRHDTDPFADKIAANAATVETFLQIMSHLLIQYDKRLDRRQPNIYRLGNFMRALQEMRSELARYNDRDDAEAMKALKKSLWNNFTEDFSPAKSLAKKIDEWVQSQKFPKMASDETSGEKESRFEQGKPADPTENMSEEDAKKWKSENEKNKDNFKAASVQLPSEEDGGKPAYDDHFRAGFEAGKKAYEKNPDIDFKDAEKAYNRVSRKYGSWWKDGFIAYIDIQRGATAHKGPQIAKKMNLTASSRSWKA